MNGLCQPRDGYQQLHLTALNGFFQWASLPAHRSRPAITVELFLPWIFFNARSHVWPSLRQSRNEMEVVGTEVQRKGKRSYPSVQLLSLGDSEGGGVKRDRRVAQCEY